MGNKIPVGLQLYTLRDETEKDFVGTLKKVAEMGYKGVEFAGYGDIEAKEMANVLSGLGLEAVSSHVPMDLLENELDRQIEYSLTIGAKYIMCPYLDLATQLEGDAFEQTINSFRHIAAQCKQHGLKFGYHNHDFEFQKRDGAYILDRIFEEFDGEDLVAELDLFWVVKAGLEPISYLKTLTGRCPIIHVKDMTKDERRTFAEVGHGSIDYQSIFAIAPDVGVQYYIVEQDACERPPLESVKMSIDYLKSIGIA